MILSLFDGCNSPFDFCLTLGKRLHLLPVELKLLARRDVVQTRGADELGHVGNTTSGVYPQRPSRAALTADAVPVTDLAVTLCRSRYIGLPSRLRNWLSVAYECHVLVLDIAQTVVEDPVQGFDSVVHLSDSGVLGPDLPFEHPFPVEQREQSFYCPFVLCDPSRGVDSIENCRVRGG